MAQRTHVLLIDDLDGSSAEETMTFGLDGAAYEIDLSAANAGVLRKALAEYVIRGRRVSTSPAGSRRRSAARSAPGARALDIAVVRSWARDNGYAINGRGRIAAEILDAYAAAH
jgi:hypothetical protein